MMTAMRYLAGGLCWASILAAQVDFGRDVQPLFREFCVGCHGPAQQMADFRLDRRSDAMRGGTIAVIAPGSSAGSRLYHKLIGNDYGTRMPPTGALSAARIQIIKDWIDQGARWPDELSGDEAAAPADAAAVRMMEALRAGDGRGFERALRENPKAANRRGAGGATPLHYAALYGRAGDIKQLAAAGADPKLANAAGATPLQWAVDSVEKSRLLIEAGAATDARSQDGQTALSIAAGRHGSLEVVKLLLEQGANPSAGKAPLTGAAAVGNVEVMRLLIDGGVSLASPPLGAALRSGCRPCAELLLPTVNRAGLSRALLGPAVRGDLATVRLLLDRGAGVDATDAQGRTVLMLAAASENTSPALLRALIAAGADVNARGAKGDTALGWALRHGSTDAIPLLRDSGAKDEAQAAPAGAKPKPAASGRAAIERSLPLLQRADEIFLKKSGCVSCHHNNVTAMAVAAARTAGLRVNEDTARRQREAIGAYLHVWRERALQGIGIAGGQDTVSYILVGLAAENHPPDAATDAMAYYLKGRQLRDGRWFVGAHRPPIESSDIEVTATCLRALRAYAPLPHKAEYKQAVQRAAAWLSKAEPRSTEDRAFQILGLKWADAEPAALSTLGRQLAKQQREDGGWAQLPSLSSDAYATGQTLYALRQSGILSGNDAAYRRGAEFLLRTQFEDGSWFVRSRAIPFQPFFESGFPFGHDQWISAAATGWAVMALAR